LTSHQTTAGDKTQTWPYPVKYGNENEITTEVLVIGGGIAGWHAGRAAPPSTSKG